MLVMLSFCFWLVAAIAAFAFGGRQPWLIPMGAGATATAALVLFSGVDPIVVQVTTFLIASAIATLHIRVTRWMRTGV